MIMPRTSLPQRMQTVEPFITMITVRGRQAIEAIAHLESLGVSENSAVSGVFLPSFDIHGNPQVVHSF